MKTPRILAVTLAVGLFAAACGGSTDEDAGGGDAAATGDAGGEDGAGGGEDVTVELARFTGDCDEATDGVTDVSQATTECEVIQILTNAFNAEDNGVTVVKVGSQSFDGYYTQLSTTFASGSAPNVALMHSHRLPDFAGRNLLRPLASDFEEVGIDFSDFTEPAADGATYEGEVYAMPFDIHGSLWHMNVDLFDAAGLVDGNGNPVLPGSPEEMLEQCSTLQDATGATYFSHDWFEFGVGARLFLGLVAQQGGNIVDADGNPTINTPEGVAAAELLNQLADECSNPQQGYTDSQQAFLSGEVAALHNGTWVVDQYNREADFAYQVSSLPVIFDEPGAWGDSHMWVMPADSNEDETVREASLMFVKYLYDNIDEWARGTGHMANRVSILEGGVLDDAPQRDNYADAADTAVFVPAVASWAGAWDALAEELNATWVDDKDIEAALTAAEGRMTEALQG